MVGPQREISLLALLDPEPLSALGESGTLDIRLVVPDDYLTDVRLVDSAGEALAIQRLLTLAQSSERLVIHWEPSAARRILGSPAIHPLAALTLCLHGALHTFPADLFRDSKLAYANARKALLGHRLTVDLFSDTQILLCVDHESPSVPTDLFDSASGTVLSEDHYEALVDDLIVRQRGTGAGKLPAAAIRLSLAVIIRELLENTQDHGRMDLARNPVRPNGLRGLIIKRVKQQIRVPGLDVALARTPSMVDCLELSVFDSGIGYYESFRRQPLTNEISHSEEWRVLLNCMKRHFDDSIPDARPGYRGMGLYEVLRAIQRLEGMFEVRTGRLHGYRTFLPGEMKLALERDDSERPGKPKPVLMDFQNPVLRQPSLEERVVGSLVRVVVPLT